MINFFSLLGFTQHSLHAQAVQNPIHGYLRWNTMNDVYFFIGRVLDTGLLLGGVFAVGLMIYAGFLYVTSAGNPDAVTKATGTITYTLVGLAVMFAAKMVILYVSGSLG